MRQTTLARRLYTATGSVEYPVITIEDGCILDISPGRLNDRPEVLTPSFLDIHVHGALGYDFMHARLEGMQAVGRFLASKGVAHYLPTTVTPLWT